LTPYATMGRQRDQVAGDFVAMTTLPGITKTSLRQSFAAAYRYTWQASLNYNRTFGEHSIGVLALYEYVKTRGNQFAADASNYPITIIQEINYGSTTQEDIIRSTGYSDTETARAGFVSRLNYAFRDRYL